MGSMLILSTGFKVGTPLKYSVGIILGLALDGRTVGAVLALLGNILGFALGVGWRVDEHVGIRLIGIVGKQLGFCVAVGVGALEVGATDGMHVGTRVGCAVGVDVGLGDGSVVGTTVGAVVGLKVMVGTLEIGCPVG